MSQITDRTGDIAQIWAVEGIEAAKLQTSGKQSYFLAPQRTIASFPFRVSERMRLNTLSDMQVLPGGSAYEFAGEFLAD